jgi:hypothetical protein
MHEMVECLADGSRASVGQLLLEPSWPTTSVSQRLPRNGKDPAVAAFRID